jgi:hypothetical protein
MPDGPRSKAPAYDDDFYAWTQFQADVLRSLDTTDNGRRPRPDRRPKND